ncbi:MAG TPA: DinB family protein [Candidatus Krumholzibacteria bacterium]|nr:DinB family protein [Candidatus Krumholzibacteria bacterium]
MRDVITDLKMVMVRELGAFQREIECFPDDELMWTTPPGVTNSAANLALHACGSMQHFVGAVLGGTGYVRNRDLEFSRRSGTRAELVRELQKTAQVVDATLSKLDDATFNAQYPEAIRGFEFTTHRVLVHMATHLAFHLGQAGYLRRVLTGENVSSSPLSMQELVG